VVKKQQVYERGKELLEKVVVEEEEVEDEAPDPVATKQSPFKSVSKETVLVEESDDGVEARHPKCCFCGCREKEPNLPPL
jgi:hypothetical protein